MLIYTSCRLHFLEVNCSGKLQGQEAREDKELSFIKENVYSNQNQSVPPILPLLILLLLLLPLLLLSMTE